MEKIILLILISTIALSSFTEPEILFKELKLDSQCIGEHCKKESIDGKFVYTTKQACLTIDGIPYYFKTNKWLGRYQTLELENNELIGYMTITNNTLYFYAVPKNKKYKTSLILYSIK